MGPIPPCGLTQCFHNLPFQVAATEQVTAPEEPEIEIPQEEDDSDLNEPEVITVYETEYVTVTKPVIVSAQPKDKPRKKQVGLTFLTVGTALAILAYFLIE